MFVYTERICWKSVPMSNRLVSSASMAVSSGSGTSGISNFFHSGWRTFGSMSESDGAVSGALSTLMMFDRCPFKIVREKIL